MISPPDPFAQQFDSIEIDRAHAPSAAAIEHAFAMVAPREDFTTPGFYLLDDAGGRFEIDRAFGVVSLRDESILLQERGAVHVAQIKVIEPSGASYEMDLTLRLTGRVPQVVGAEDLALLAGIADAPVIEREHAPPALALRETVSWSRYAPATATAPADVLGDEDAPFGALLSPEMPRRAGGSAILALSEGPPAPAPRTAHWAV